MPETPAGHLSNCDGCMHCAWQLVETCSVGQERVSALVVNTVSIFNTEYLSLAF